MANLHELCIWLIKVHLRLKSESKRPCTAQLDFLIDPSPLDEPVKAASNNFTWFQCANVSRWVIIQMWGPSWFLVLFFYPSKMLPFDVWLIIIFRISWVSGTNYSVRSKAPPIFFFFGLAGLELAHFGLSLALLSISIRAWPAHEAWNCLILELNFDRVKKSKKPINPAQTYSRCYR